MGMLPHPNKNKPRTTEEGGSVRITIPKGIRDALDLEGGERPEEMEYDPEDRRVSMEFGAQD